MNGGSDEGFDDTPRPSTQASQLTIIELSHGAHSIGYVDHSVELEICYFSDSSLFQSSLFREFTSSRMPSPKFETQRADMFMLEDPNRVENMNSPATSHSILASPSYTSGDYDTPKSSVDLFPGWPLMHHTINLDKIAPVLGCPSPDMRSAISSSPLHHLSVEKEKPRSSPLYRFSPEKKPGSLLRHFTDKVKTGQSPVHQSFSGQEITVSSRMSYDRHMSVVDWALQLPHRNKDLAKSPERFTEEDYGKLLGELARDAFKAGSGHVEKFSTEMSVEAGLDGSWYRANKKVKFSVEEHKPKKCRKLDVKMLLAQRLDALCLDRKCAAFAYDELDAATSSFSSSKSLQDISLTSVFSPFESVRYGYFVAACDSESRVFFAGNVVGRGGGSEVYKGMLADGKLVAVKRLNCGPQAEEELLNDVSVNTSLSHPHVVALLGYCVGSSHLILVYDYLPEGNLEDRLHGKASINYLVVFHLYFTYSLSLRREEF